MKQKILAYILSIFSESDGSGSASRVLAGVSVLSTIVWVSYLTFTTRHLPDLGGASLFLTSAFSGYSVNKISSCFKKEETTITKE
jgi:hypothetical protein